LVLWNFEQVQESKECKIWTKDISSTIHPKTKVYMAWEHGAWSLIVLLDLQVVTIFILLPPPTPSLDYKHFDLPKVENR
jgi:hypothetical protein